MKKRIISMALTFLLCLSLFPVAALAAEDEVTIKIPGCDATFTLESAGPEYGVIEGDVTEYIFALPGENGKMSCDTRALASLYGQFTGDDPRDSNAGGGDPVFEADWSYGYNFAGTPGKGITIVSVFVLADGSLADTEILPEYVCKITFFMGYPISYGYGAPVQLPENLISAAAELHPLSGLFTDAVPPIAETPSAWALEAVDRAIAAGLLPEALQSKYTTATTRAEFCALAVALYENVVGSEISGRMEFDDTSDVNVQKMASLEVVNGIGDNKFGPENKLTREQAATMLSRLANAIGKPLAAQAPAFNDNSAISSWAFGAAGQMQTTGIMGGVGDNTFAPQADYTREQSIATMMRLFDIVK